MAAIPKPTGKLPHVTTYTKGKAGNASGPSGVILHKAGCGGNHLGACNC